MSRRLEITVSEGLWVRLNEVRGFEPRASFVKRALERALDGVAASGFDSERVLVAGSVPARPASPRASVPAAVLDAVAPDSSSGRGKASRPMVPVPGVVRASSLAKVGVKPIPKRGK